jgi:hypothetical protein
MNEFVFYNRETGKPFVDLDAGLELACRKAGIEDVTGMSCVTRLHFVWLRQGRIE